MTTRNEMRKMDDDEFFFFLKAQSFEYREVRELGDILDEFFERIDTTRIAHAEMVTALTNKINKLEDRINTL